jgi:leucyl aminopeptidase
MAPSNHPTVVRLSTDDPAGVETDLLVVPAFDGEAVGDTLPAIDQATQGEVKRATASGEIKGRLYETFVTPASGGGWKAGRVAIIGAGKAADFTSERLRKVAAAAALMARGRRIPRVAFLLRGPIPARAAVQAITEGLILAGFSVDQYKTGERFGPPPTALTVVAPKREFTETPALEEAVRRGQILGDSSNLARGFANEPSNILTPRVFADRAAAICKEAGVGVEVLDEKQIEKLGMGLLLGVARGSAEPPRVIVMRHDPPGAPASPVLGLVGKGITFDTGGISIKPAEGMERMKDDMAGGAAVVCAMRAIALLKAPIRVVGIVPTTENMPGGKSMKPGDVLTGAGGKTVEVINTDAEGRLILGDGLWYAQELGATHLVDVATLTGACVVGLGKAASGLFGRPDAWRETVRTVADAAGDRCWPLPLYDEYFDQIRSEIADMINSGGRAGGACTAAIFLKEFTNDLPWAHLDIAGTAWAEEGKPYQPKGPIGVAVRTLAELPFSYQSW